MLLLCMNTSSNDMHLTKDEMLSYADVNMSILGSV